jgi:magnesium transporter
VPGSASAQVTLLTIDSDGLASPRPLTDLSRLPVPESGKCHWVRVTGLGSLEPLQAICNFYGIQNMILEDILSPGWRSKHEQAGEFLFISLQAPPENQPEAKIEHLYLLYKAGLIVTFADSPTTLVDTLWKRIMAAPAAAATLHSAGAYLAYATVDIAIDRFFFLLYKEDDMLAELEDLIAIRVPSREEMNKLHAVKRELITLRRLITPYREIEADFRQIHVDQTDTGLAPYLNDLHDHIIQAVELVEAYHNIAGSLYDIYQSAMTNHMNDIIKVLTIISTIFMPLTFIAGVYGMNFEYMPEIKSVYGYPSVLCVMLTVFVGMILFFHKKKWF